jgi:hypothetical protein
MMVDFSEYGLFERKDGTKVTYEDLLRDIYQNSEEDRDAVALLVKKLTDQINTASDAAMLMESVTQLMDARIKNNDLMVKVASIVSRIIQRGMTSTDSEADWEISEEEKKQLLMEVEEALDNK